MVLCTLTAFRHCLFGDVYRGASGIRLFHREYFGDISFYQRRYWSGIHADGVQQRHKLWLGAHCLQGYEHVLVGLLQVLQDYRLS